MFNCDARRQAAQPTGRLLDLPGKELPHPFLQRPDVLLWEVPQQYHGDWELPSYWQEALWGGAGGSVQLRGWSGWGDRIVGPVVTACIHEEILFTEVLLSLKLWKFVTALKLRLTDKCGFKRKLETLELLCLNTGISEISFWLLGNGLKFKS